MKIALGVIATVLQVLSFCDAYAHGDHKPNHGGIMGRGDDEISVELVMDSGTVILFVEQDDKPLPSEKVKGTLSVAGPERPAQEAKRRFTTADHEKATAGIECRKDEDVIDETPAAYKDIESVMNAQSDLVEIAHMLRQVVCVKG